MHWSLWVLVVWLCSIISFFVGVWIREQKAKDAETFLRKCLMDQRAMIEVDKRTIKELTDTSAFRIDLLSYIDEQLAAAKGKVDLMDGYRMIEEKKYYMGVRHGLHIILFKIQGRI